MDEEGWAPQPAGLSVCILFQARASSPVHSCRTALAIPPARGQARSATSPTSPRWSASCRGLWEPAALTGD